MRESGPLGLRAARETKLHSRGQGLLPTLFHHAITAIAESLRFAFVVYAQIEKSRVERNAFLKEQFDVAIIESYTMLGSVYPALDTVTQPHAAIGVASNLQAPFVGFIGDRLGQFEG